MRLNHATKYADYCLAKLHEAQDTGKDYQIDVAVYRDAVSAEYRLMRRLRDLSPNAEMQLAGDSDGLTSKKGAPAG